MTKVLRPIIQAEQRAEGRRRRKEHNAQQRQQRIAAQHYRDLITGANDKATARYCEWVKRAWAASDFSAKKGGGK